MTPEPLSWHIGGDDSRTAVVLRGTLAMGSAARLRTVLLKCLAEQPAALLVDLSGITVPEPRALAVFTAVVRQAATWPGIPVVLCAPPPEVATLLAAGGFGRLPVHATVERAVAALGDSRATLPVLSDQLLPVTGAARHARDMVTDACARWELPELVGPAGTVVSELVSNVIDHVGTMMTLRISLRGRYLHVALHDGSPAAPEPGVPARPGTSGLAVVQAMVTNWGWLPTTDGKVVWAILAKP